MDPASDAGGLRADLHLKLALSASNFYAEQIAIQQKKD
jgi:hypothetical protein